MGIIGGRPNHAIYFFGHQGDVLHGMDPHTTQPTPPFDCTLPQSSAGAGWEPDEAGLAEVDDACVASGGGGRVTASSGS